MDSLKGKRRLSIASNQYKFERQIHEHDMLMNIFNDGDFIENPIIDFLTKGQEEEQTIHALEAQTIQNQDSEQEDFEQIFFRNWQDTHIPQGETLIEEMINKYSETLGQEEQKIVNIKEENLSKLLLDEMFPDIAIEEAAKHNNDDNFIFQSLPQKEQIDPDIDQFNIKNQFNIKEEKVKTEIITEIKQEEQEACVDIETIPDTTLPVLEARDIKSLWEQFEATTEVAIPSPVNIPIVTSVPNIKPGKRRGRPPKNGKKTVAKKATMSSSNQRKASCAQIPKKQPKLKDTISLMPLTTHQDYECTKNNRNNKISKSMLSCTSSSSGTSVHLDHDYCSNAAYANSSKTYINLESSILKFGQTSKNTTVTGKCSDAIKECRVLASRITTNIKKISTIALRIEESKIIEDLQKNKPKVCQEKSVLKQVQVLNNSLSAKTTDAPKKSLKKAVTLGETKIRSVLANNILKSREINLNKIQTPHIPYTSMQHMVSVLKPLNGLQHTHISPSNFRESIVTTTNSSNNEIQNIIIENTEDSPMQKESKAPVRKKLTLEEYRNRGDQTCNNRNKTNSPTSRAALVYISHACTTTEPIIGNNNQMIWCEREIIATVESQSDIEEKRRKPKPATYDIAVQTYETVFEFTADPALNEKDDSKENKRLSSTQSRSRSSSKDKTRKRGRSNSRSRSRSRNKCKKRSISRSRSRSLNSNDSNMSRSERGSNNNSRNESSSDNNSRSRYRNWKKGRGRKSNRSENSSESKNRSTSNGRNRNKSRSWKNSRNKNSNDSKDRSREDRRTRSRSRSRRHSRTHSRQRQISRRRSSVSSSSSRSCTSSSGSSSWRSTSRSYQNSSRSSSQYQSSCSRSSSTSNFERTRWPSRRNSSDRERSYDRYKRRCSTDRHDQNWRSRSPANYYSKYDNWYYKEKQKQVEERRVIYVGRIGTTITKADLRRRFEVFGPIVEISIHSRPEGDNYGFVTFEFKIDAFEALEHGNDDPTLPPYDLSFGGRRAFCKVEYADLDGMTSSSPNNKSISPTNGENSFDFLLKQAMKRQRLV